MTNCTAAVRKLPILMSVPCSVSTTLLKSGLPTNAAINWPSTSLVNEVITALKAAPRTTATARSTTFPRRIKSRRSEERRGGSDWSSDVCSSDLDQLAQHVLGE